MAYAVSVDTATWSQSEQASSVDQEKTVTENGHTYTVKYLAAEEMFVSYIDGQEVNRISYDKLKTKAEDAERSAKQERASKCGVGMAVAGVVNGALWTGAAIAAPASAGTTIAIASFATSLIPTVGGAVAC